MGSFAVVGGNMHDETVERAGYIVDVSIDTINFGLTYKF